MQLTVLRQAWDSQDFVEPSGPAPRQQHSISVNQLTTAAATHAAMCVPATVKFQIWTTDLINFKQRYLSNQSELIRQQQTNLLVKYPTPYN